MFKFTKIKYSKSRRGILVQGNINYKGKIVGTFSQEPYGACLSFFPDPKVKEEFLCEAMRNYSDFVHYSEKLLNEAEEEILK